MAIEDKILALRNITPENGATLEEAASALEMANKLMQKYFITEDQLRKVKKSDFILVNRKQFTKTKEEIVVLLGPIIAKFCGVEIWFLSSTALWNSKDVRYTAQLFGLPEDIEFANYLLNMLVLSVKRSYRDWKKNLHESWAFSEHQMYWDFRKGFAIQLQNLVNELLDQNRVASTGTDLVVLKDQMLRDAMSDIEFSGRKVAMPGGQIKSGMVAAAGMVAAKSVSLSRPIEETKQEQLR